MIARRSLLAALLSVICTVALLPGGAAQAAAGDGWFRIVNALGFALAADDTYEGGNAEFANPEPTSGAPVYAQAWLRVRDPDGLLRFRNAVAPAWYALTVNTGLDWVNKPVILMGNNTNFANQKWRAVPASNGFVLLQNPYTGKCIGTPPTGNLSVYVVACNANDNIQRWKVTDND
ncbi:RICIN domain-containing protein [Paractinoplanes maris]|uniref:RICIN domain-containing protein n=1 Tax=Paractinoplanes maris TaxID=1734446 RepID=UPI00202187E5|nr:RICIN domain-containing protein [Actinoplanes maris]